MNTSTHHAANREPQHTSSGKNYRKLAIMLLLSFIAMYVLMYAMVNTISNVYPNVNQFYMAGLMAMPMIVIEVLLMRMMYRNKKLNAVILTLSVLLCLGFFSAIRKQAAVTDRQFIKSMIPHHSGAILMCKEADLKDPELRKLCEEINASQQSEIEQMKAILKRIEQ